MNKYLVLIILGVLIVGGGVIYRSFFLAEESKPVDTGTVREITVTAKKDNWAFAPEVVEVNRGDRIVMTVVNEDSYDHGISIDYFGVAQRIPANGTIKIEFTVTQAGDFPFYCSVPCGEGIVDGKKRTHFDMIGVLRARNIVNTE